MPLLVVKNSQKIKTNKKYFWKTVQKDITPLAYCEGYLQLDENNIPHKFSISIASVYDIWNPTKWEYIINKGCQDDGKSILYTNLTEQSKSPQIDTGTMQSLRIKKTGDIYQARFEPVPTAWLKGPGVPFTNSFIHITIKNAKEPQVKECNLNGAITIVDMSFVDWKEQPVPSWKDCTKSTPTSTNAN
jgi:hypothetical protein